ncbi:MAG: glycosyl hydrolase 108 family protein, partial [Pseudolabrys sp.]
MAATNYDDALRRLLVHEGGYTNNPSDPGGPTNFGITIYDYRKYVKPNATAADIRSMRLEDAKAIYRAKYWNAQRCDELPAGVDYAVFDYGVNSGIGRSGKVLRRVLNFADNTSAVNDTVIAAARGADAKSVIVAICDERLRFLQSLKTWSVFGAGWGRRVAEVKAVALAMASGAPAPDLPHTNASGRAVVPLAKGAQQGSAGAIA